MINAPARRFALASDPDLLPACCAVRRVSQGATVLGIVSFYGGVTYPSKRQSPPPMTVADLINECVLSNDDAWRFKSHTRRPVFMSNETPPPMVTNPLFLEQT
jgi:hypothetical protein